MWIFFVGLRPRVSVQDHKMKTKTSPEMAAVYLTCDSNRTFSCKSQRRNGLTIDSDSLISLMAPHHSLRWMDVRGCARSNIVTSSPYWLNIQYECIMTHCSPHSSYIRARQNETCCCFTLWSTFFGVSLQLFVLISIKVLIHHSFLYVFLRKQELRMYWNVQTYKAKKTPTELVQF